MPRVEIQQYTKVCPVRWSAAIAVEWAIIIATLGACAVVGSWWVYVPAFLLIGTRQHALGILAHEGSHHLVSSRPWVNDLLSDLLAAYPIGFTTVGFRTMHFRHHAFLETVKDPSRVTVDLFPKDWAFPMTRGRVLRIIARDLTGLSQASSSKLLEYLWEIPGGRGRHLVQLLAFHAAVIGVAFWAGLVWMYLLLWLLPLFTAAIAFYRIRAVAEHSGLDSHQLRYLDESAEPLSATRTTIHKNRVARFLLSPHNVSYHIEHHLYPSVPMWQLPRLHARLVQNPAYNQRAHLTAGHVGLLRELTVAAG